MKLLKRLLPLSTVLSLGAFAYSCGGPMDFVQSQVTDFTRYQLFGNDLPDKTITLTFDDGPAGRTLELANYLYAEGIRATFFVVGTNARGNEGILKTIQSLGHLVANHSHRHEAMTSVGDPIEAVRATDNIIAPYTTGDMFLFRAPYGDWSGWVADILNANGLRKYVGSVFWDVGGDLTQRYSADWACWGRGLDVSDCGQGYLNEIGDKRRGIVLLHDVHSKTVDMVKWMVPRLKSSGYSFVRLDAVPNVAAQIRKAGGTPGAGTAPKELGKIDCSEGFTLTKVGVEGGKVCVGGDKMEGPFTQAMRDKCVAWGGGQTCYTNVWSKAFALNIRQAGICPVGSAYDSQTKYCVEGSEALGPFPSELKQKCVEAGNSEAACASNRWDRGVLAGLL